MVWLWHDAPAGAAGEGTGARSPRVLPTTALGDDGPRDAGSSASRSARLIGTLRERFRLTTSEARVALLLAARWSNREIAEMLGVTAHTARRHTEKVLLKLGIHSRTRVRSVIAALDRREGARSDREYVARSVSDWASAGGAPGYLSEERS